MINSLDSRSVNQGSAIAVSRAVLLTNCHVVNQKEKNIYILEKGIRRKAFLVHSEPIKDQCFIRSLNLELSPVLGVKPRRNISRNDVSYAIGAPKGKNRTITNGIISDTKLSINGYKRMATTSLIKPGSSGGGLMGVTTGKFDGKFYAIFAEDFWK